METLELYQLAESNNVSVLFAPLPLTGSCSVEDDGYCSIGLDPRKCETQALERERLAHEMGHCLSAGFYDKHTDKVTRAKVELRSDKWAVSKLIPWDELRNAFRDGHTEMWDLAEYFNVTEAFVRKAISVYERMGKLGG